MHQLKPPQKVHKTHFISGANCYIFWHHRCHHQAACQQQNFVGPTSMSGAIRPHFHYKALQC
jgi:hypothetical protein